MGRPSNKGDATRVMILEAAIDCLAERPYSDVSAGLVADRAGVSRGGMQYHFPTRLSLLQGTVEYLQSLRLELFRRDLASAPQESDLVDHVIEQHWRHLNEREFRAYQELVLASRSEPELAALLASGYRPFLDAWQELARSRFGWDPSEPNVARASNVAHYVLEGMAYGRLASQLNEAEVRQLLEFAKETLRTQFTPSGQ